MPELSGPSASAAVAFFVLVIVGAGFVQRLTGFGFALVTLSLLPYCMDIRVANLVTTLACFPPLVWMCARTWRDADRRALTITAGSAVAGLPLGLVVFAWMDTEWLVRGTGLVVLVIVAHLLRGERAGATKPAGAVWGLAAGFVSGVLSGAVGVPGPPVVAYAARQPWPPDRFRAFTAAFFACLSVFKVVGVVACGFVTAEIWFWSGLGIPLVFVGHVIANRFAARIDAPTFRAFVFGLLILSGLKMLF